MSARRQQIRALAAQTRNRYAERYPGGAPLPVPAHNVAEYLFDLPVIPYPPLDPNISGKLDLQFGAIVVRVGLAPDRERFIVAHELGHLVLEGAAAGSTVDNDQSIDERAGGDGVEGAVRVYNTRERREQEANLFALELLVPADALWEQLQQPGTTITSLAAHFGVSPDALATQLVNVCCLAPPAAPGHSSAPKRPAPPDPDQQAAVVAPLPTLVVAGPGTGKTRSMVAKYLALVEAGADPAAILTLTFSNRTAEEMRGRIIAALNQARPGLAGRVEISTFHAWGLNFLREYGKAIGLPLDVQLRDSGDLFILLKRRLAELKLEQFKNLRDPAEYLPDLLRAIGRAKDELRTPEEVAALAEAGALALMEIAAKARAEQEARIAAGKRPLKKLETEVAKAERDMARLRELAVVYTRYEAILRDAGVLDYGDLVMRSVEALRIPAVAASIHARYQYILVDEFQDINYASGVLVSLIDGGRGRVWAVGDPWQSIYRFRGAAPVNLTDFPLTYPGATTSTLAQNYRSLQSILDASHAIMGDDPLASSRPPLTSQRGSRRGQPVREQVAVTPEDECAAIAHDIIRRAIPRRARRPACVTGPRVRPLSSRPARRPGHYRRRWRFADHVVLCRKHAHAASVVAALEAHNIPVAWSGEIYDYAEVKDALAICAMVRTTSTAGTLRALTIPEYAISDDDLRDLVFAARRARKALSRAARDPDLIVGLSPEAQLRLATLRVAVDALGAVGDAWQVLVGYLFEHSAGMRERIRRAARGDGAARRELANLGQLILAAGGFVRQAPPHERGAAHFVEYVRALREAGAAGGAPAPIDGDVVRVMTVHGAKGLEFPIVYVPFLQNKQFPSAGRSLRIPEIPGLSRSPLGDALQEERYLLYVAMTRARDRLVLSRALTYHEKPVERSPLLAGDGAASTPWPIIDVPPALSCPPGLEEVRLRVTPPVQMPVPASSLDTYDTCPRQYLYQYVYQLYDDTTPYLRMHQTIRETVASLAEQARVGDLAHDDEGLRTLLQRSFLKNELEAVLYSDDYFAEAWRHVQVVWGSLSTAAVAPEQVNHTVTLTRRTGEVRVRVDRVEAGTAGPRWVRTRSNQARSNDHLSSRVMLYALAYQQQHGRPGEIQLHYTATGETRDAWPEPDVLKRHAATIDGHLASMAAGQWPIQPGPHCDTCPFNLICPV